MKKKTFKKAIVFLAMLLLVFGSLAAGRPQSVSAAVRNRFVVKNGSYYFYDKSGKPVKGWHRSKDGIYYFDKVTGAAKPGLQVVGKKKYYFSRRGKMLTGWKTVNKKTYFFDSTKGYLHVHEILKTGGKRYYLDHDGVRRTGKIKIGSNWYAFSRKTGEQLVNSWYQDTDGAKYFAGKNYSMVKGFYKVASSWYYFRPSDRRMLVGWQTIGGHRYLFHNKTGVRFEKCKVTLSKNMYCFDTKGRLCRDRWAKINGKTYYAQSNGLLVTGWLTRTEGKYYFNSKGEMRTGWITVKGKKYYMEPSTGIMAKSKWIDKNHYVGKDGAWIKGYVEKDLRWPLSSQYNSISSYFGPRNKPGANASSYHKGIDIPAPQGTPIYAAAAGTVKLIQVESESGGAGNYTQIEHSKGIVTEYMHQSKFANIKVGMKVKKGQLIGYVGNTGNSYGAHLHFGVIDNGERKDPLKYVNVPE